MNKEKTKSWIITTILLIVVIGIMIVIGNLMKTPDINGNSTYNNSNNSNLNEQTIKCIGGNSKIVVSKTCSACAYQKQILSDYFKNYLDYIEIISISEHPEILKEYNIEGVPTWIIDEKIYVGAQSINKLKELTKC